MSPTHIASPMPVVRDAAPTACLGSTVPLTERVWVAVGQASQITGFAVGTLNNLRASTPPRGPAFHKIGRTIRYDVAELHRWLDSGRVETSAA